MDQYRYRKNYNRSGGGILPKRDDKKIVIFYTNWYIGLDCSLHYDLDKASVFNIYVDPPAWSKGVSVIEYLKLFGLQFSVEFKVLGFGFEFRTLIRSRIFSDKEKIMTNEEKWKLLGMEV